MKSIIKTSKRSISAILTLCMLLCIAGTCLNVTAMAAETTATVKETAVATEDTTVMTGENTQELVPIMARACWGTLDEALNYYIGKNNWSYDENGMPQADGFTIRVVNGYCHVTGNDVNYSFYFG